MRPLRKVAWGRENIEKTKKWLRECRVHSIRKCEDKRVPQTMPTRVTRISLSDPGNVAVVNTRNRLSEKRGVVSPYIALSYCWVGVDGNRLKTTRDALVERETSIVVNELPRT